MCSSPVAWVEEGKLEGTFYQLPNGRIVSAFLVVPYAAPPVYENRFKMYLQLASICLFIHISAGKSVASTSSPYTNPVTEPSSASPSTEEPSADYKVPNQYPYSRQFFKPLLTPSNQYAAQQPSPYEQPNYFGQPPNGVSSALGQPPWGVSSAALGQPPWGVSSAALGQPPWGVSSAALGQPPWGVSSAALGQPPHGGSAAYLNQA